MNVKKGDRVRHKLSGDTLTVIRINESVATCRRDIPEITYWFCKPIEIWTAVCLIDNLEIVN